MKGTLLIAASIVALAGVAANASAADNYEDRIFQQCGVDDTLCILGGPLYEGPEDQRCSVVDSAMKGIGDDGVVDCATTP